MLCYFVVHLLRLKKDVTLMQAKLLQSLYEVLRNVGIFSTLCLLISLVLGARLLSIFSRHNCLHQCLCLKLWLNLEHLILTSMHVIVLFYHVCYSHRLFFLFFKIVGGVVGNKCAVSILVFHQDKRDTHYTITINKKPIPVLQTHKILLPLVNLTYASSPVGEGVMRIGQAWGS